MKKLFLISASLLLAYFGYAQKGMTIEEYKNNVLNYSQQIKKASAEVVAASEQILVARSGMVPKIDGAVDFNYMVKKISFELGPGQKLTMKPYNYGVSVTAAQNVYAGGAVKKQVDLYRTSEEVAKEALNLTTENIIYAAEMSYWATSVTASYLKAANQYLDVINSTYNVVEKRFKDGLISKTDLLMVETRIKEAQYQLSEVEKNYKESIINMNILMGNKSNVPFAIIDSVFVDTPLTTVGSTELDDFLDKKPEYRIAMNTVRINEQKLRLTQSAYLPKVAIGVTGQYAPSSLNFTGEGIPNLIAFAQIKVPIFSGGERRHKTRIDQVAIRSSEYEKQMTIDNLSQDFMNAKSSLEETIKQLDIAKQSLLIAEESLSLNAYSYNEGLLTILDVLSAQLSWLGAYNNYITTNFNYRTALTEYNKVIGVFADK